MRTPNDQWDIVCDPADAESARLDRISGLAVPGSTVVVENFGSAFDQLQHDPTLPRFGRAFGVEVSGLVDMSERRPPTPPSSSTPRSGAPRR